MNVKHLHKQLISNLQRDNERLGKSNKTLVAKLNITTAELVQAQAELEGLRYIAGLFTAFDEIIASNDNALICQFINHYRRESRENLSHQ